MGGRRGAKSLPLRMVRGRVGRVRGGPVSLEGRALRARAFDGQAGGLAELAPPGLLTVAEQIGEQVEDLIFGEGVEHTRGHV